MQYHESSLRIDASPVDWSDADTAEMPLIVSNFQLDLASITIGIQKRNKLAAKILQEDLNGKFYYACNSCSKVFTSKDRLRAHDTVHKPTVKITNKPEPETDPETEPEPETPRHRHRHHKKKKKKKHHHKSKKVKKEKKVKVQTSAAIAKSIQLKISAIKATAKTKVKSKRLNNNTSQNKHLNPHKCKFCSSRFTSPWNLKVHLQTIHENIRPFQCNLCDKSFKQKIHLLGHFNSTHSNVKPFKCDSCSVKFAKKWNLFDHVKKYHSGSQHQLDKLKLKYSKRRKDKS